MGHCNGLVGLSDDTACELPVISPAHLPHPKQLHCLAALLHNWLCGENIPTLPNLFTLGESGRLSQAVSPAPPMFPITVWCWRHELTLACEDQMKKAWPERKDAEQPSRVVWLLLLEPLQPTCLSVSISHAEHIQLRQQLKN